MLPTGVKASSPRRRLRRLSSQLLACGPTTAAETREESLEYRAQVQKEYGADWWEYREAGRARARALGNHGPMRFDKDGKLAKDILQAYYAAGFYLFENVLSKGEVQELTAEFDAALANAPWPTQESLTDKQGRPCRFPGYFSVNKQGVVGTVQHPLIIMDSALRCFGHPEILRMVESVHGPDFVPGPAEVIFHKAAGEGVPTAWHQDGRTHWDLGNDGAALEQTDGTGKRHGFNLSVCWSTCTPENCLWVVPGSQRRWRLANGGNFPKISERLQEAVPALLAPGDLCMVNRSSMHGSYPNKSSERRVTMVMAYQNRASIVGAETTNVHAFRLAGQREKRVKYTEEYVMKRTRMIPLAIDARKQKYPHETPYEYKGSYLGGGEWNERARAEITKEGDEYWQRNFTI